MNDLPVVAVIWRRDMIRLSRDRAQIAGSLARPILWLLVLGLGMGSAFPGFGGVSYISYLFPGIVAMNLLFASFLSAISIIWDREFGFLKEMLVAPISRASIAIGKAASGASTACLQGCLVLCFFPLVGLSLNPLQILAGLPIMFLIAFAMTGLGLLVAARMTSFEGFGTIANFVIMPMFFLSGAVFPLTNSPLLIRLLGAANPLAYGVDALRLVFLGASHFPLGLNLAVLFAFSAVTLSGAIRAFRRSL